MTTTERIGTLLYRIVVPLWVLTGAVLKLYERTPKLLPKTIWEGAHSLGANLYWLLAVIIGLELLAVGVMFFLPRLARAMALFMLSAFCVILLAEIATGNAHCGCLGAYSPSPWVMLAIDASLLAGVLFLGKRGDGPLLPARGLSLAAAWVALGFGVSFALILPQRSHTAVEAVPLSPVRLNDAPELGSLTAPFPDPLPGYYVPSAKDWQGKTWETLDIARYMPAWPRDVSTGQRYVIFYSRSCEHCEQLFTLRFLEPHGIPTTIVAIPETKQGFDETGRLPMMCTDCEELELPVGCDWIITTPLVVALEEGRVVCAKEGEDPEAPECLLFH